MRSRANRRRLSDNDIRCSASDRRWFPARPAQHVHRRRNNGRGRIQSALASARGRKGKRRVETCSACNAMVGTRSRAIRRGTSIDANKPKFRSLTRPRPRRRPSPSMRRRFLQRKEPDCSAIILFSYSDCENIRISEDEDDDEHEEKSPISEFRLKAISAGHA